MDSVHDQFNQSWQRLRQQWLKTKEQWSDGVQLQFEHVFWDPIEKQVPITMLEMATLKEIIDGMRRNVS